MALGYSLRVKYTCITRCNVCRIDLREQSKRSQNTGGGDVGSRDGSGSLAGRGARGRGRSGGGGRARRSGAGRRGHRGGHGAGHGGGGGGGGRAAGGGRAGGRRSGRAGASGTLRQVGDAGAAADVVGELNGACVAEGISGQLSVEK